MMEIFYETYVPLLIVGAVILFFLISFWFITGNSKILLAIPIPLGVIVGGIVLDAAVETNREGVMRTFDGIREAILNKDIPAVKRFLTPEAQQTLSRVQWALDAITIRKIGIYDLDLAFNDFTIPPTAKAEFQGVVKFKAKEEKNNFGETYVARFTVELEKEDDCWLITHHIEKHEGL